MKRTHRTGLGLTLATLIGAGACGAGGSGGSGGSADASGSSPDAGPASGERPTAVLVVKDHGEIRIELLPEKAPKTVENFLKLAREDFYDGTTFHRVIPGFMVQGGDPRSRDDDPRNDGTGGPGYTIAAEFNDTPHERGVVSMARRSHPDSAGSQFFIVHRVAPHLDGKYTAFGRVVSGMEVVDAIAEVERDARDRPVNDVVVEEVRVGE